jgi:hypothetical protein
MFAIATDPLRFPSDYPPKDRWKRFFIGIRWLGPDLSFFKVLKAQQAARTNDQMRTWGGGTRQEIAALISETLSQSLGWKTTVFLPQDVFAVACHGPTFDCIDGCYSLKEAIESLEKKYAVAISDTFWVGMEEATFGEVVDAIVKLRDG